MYVNNDPEYCRVLDASGKSVVTSNGQVSDKTVNSIFDLSSFKNENGSYNLDSAKYEPLEPKQNRALGFLWTTGSYTYTSSSGVKVTVVNISDGIQIFEDKETGEVIIIGADGAIIESGSANGKISVYDSTIDKINTKKGDDELRIYDSTIGSIETGNGNDSIIIENSTVEKKINAGLGDDYISITDSVIQNVNTSKTLAWNSNIIDLAQILFFDDGKDTVILNNTQANKIQTGLGSDKVIANNSKAVSYNTRGKSNSVSLNNTSIDKLKTDKNDTVIKDNNYETLNIDIKNVLEIESNAVIPIDNEGNAIPLNQYVEYILNQPVGFKTEEEYQEYIINSLSMSISSMQSMFDNQEKKDGVISNGYNTLKELTGLGISDDDVKNILAKQTEILEGLKKAKNGESIMTFEQAYKYYTGVDFSKEKIDNHIKLSNTYQAVMTASQFDCEYIEKFEQKTGIKVEKIAQEYYSAQMEAMGKSTVLSELVENYSIDQNSFADKLSSAISIAGLSCMVVGAVLCIIPGCGLAGAPLMTAGKYISLGGMFIDNAMDLTDDMTDADGLTNDELKNFAFETGVETVSYLAGRGIGKLTNGLNTVVTNKAVEEGMGKIGSYIIGQAAETVTDGVLSLGADYLIAQGQAYIATGEFMEPSDYWNMDRFLGEGKNQLIGILTGLASAKLNSYQAGIYATAGQKLLTEDPLTIKQYMKSQGLSDVEINKFFEGVDIETYANRSTITAQDNPTLAKMVAQGSIAPDAADTFAKYGLTDSQIKIAQARMTEGATASEAAICANYNLSHADYQNARLLMDNNPDTSFAQSANIAKNSTVYKMLTTGEIASFEDASIYASRNFSKSDIKKAVEFKNEHPEANTSQAAIISSNKTVSKMFEQGEIKTIEDAAIYSELGLTRTQIQNAINLALIEELPTSAASIIARNELVYNMYKQGEIDSIEDALKYAQNYRYKSDIICAMGECMPLATQRRQNDCVITSFYNATGGRKFIDELIDNGGFKTEIDGKTVEVKIECNSNDPDTRLEAFELALEKAGIDFESTNAQALASILIGKNTGYAFNATDTDIRGLKDMLSESEVLLCGINGHEYTISKITHDGKIILIDAKDGTRFEVDYDTLIEQNAQLNGYSSKYGFIIGDDIKVFNGTTPKPVIKTAKMTDGTIDYEDIACGSTNLFDYMIENESVFRKIVDSCIDKQTLKYDESAIETLCKKLTMLTDGSFSNVDDELVQITTKALTQQSGYERIIDTIEKTINCSEVDNAYKTVMFEALISGNGTSADFRNIAKAFEQNGEFLSQKIIQADGSEISTYNHLLKIADRYGVDLAQLNFYLNRSLGQTSIESLENLLKVAPLYNQAHYGHEEPLANIKKWWEQQLKLRANERDPLFTAISDKLKADAKFGENNYTEITVNGTVKYVHGTLSSTNSPIKSSDFQNPSKSANPAKTRQAIKDLISSNTFTKELLSSTVVQNWLLSMDPSLEPIITKHNDTTSGRGGYARLSEAEIHAVTETIKLNYNKYTGVACIEDVIRNNAVLASNLETIYHLANNLGTTANLDLTSTGTHGAVRILTRDLVNVYDYKNNRYTELVPLVDGLLGTLTPGTSTGSANSPDTFTFNGTKYSYYTVTRAGSNTVEIYLPDLNSINGRFRIVVAYNNSTGKYNLVTTY